MKARTTPQRSHRRVARQAIWLPLLLACLAAPASGADVPDTSQLTVDRIFGPEQEFKTEDWGPAYWLKNSSDYTTLEVAERFKDSEGAKDANTIKDIVQYAPESGQRNEEEFGLRNGLRWSPDGKFIAYWQFDTTGVREFKLINNTDTLHPQITAFAYPKVGETNSACRVGVVKASGGKTRWFRPTTDPRNHYIPRMEWAKDSRHVLFQQLNRKR